MQFFGGFFIEAHAISSHTVAIAFWCWRSVCRFELCPRLTWPQKKEPLESGSAIFTGGGLVRYVERRTLLANGSIDLIPFLLGGAVCISLQRRFIGELHDKRIGLAALNLD